MASPVANGAPSEANGSVSRSSAPGHQQGKSSFAQKMSENNRKAEEDSQQRRTPQPKAWASGINPITQRSNTPSQVNGAGQRSANGTEKTIDRQAWMLANSIGLQCTVLLRGGERFTGVFAAAQKSSERLLFKMVKNITKDAASAEYCGEGPEHLMVFSTSSLESFEVPEATPLTKGASNGSHSGFRTDTDISGNASVRERKLQRWQGSSSKDVDMSLESSSTGDWDQFKVNEQQFGIKSDYDENIYTTVIDTKNPLYAQRHRDAERIAREIESSSSSNAHVREERGLDHGEEDEEEKYSGVRRNYQPLESAQPGRYVPPSKRAPASAGLAPSSSQPVQPTIPVVPSSRAPVDTTLDPAIISSQIAKPEASTETPKQSGAQALATAPSSATTVPKSSTTSKETNPAVAAATKGNVENRVLDSFRTFAANEKIKVQDQKRSRAFQDKAVKLNDLMKFSKNFKLLTPVPKDLVPILAKDEGKQKEIIEKAQLNAQTKATKSPTSMPDQKYTRPLAPARWDQEVKTPAADASNRGPSASSGQTVPAKEQSATRSQAPQVQPPQGSLSTRLNNNHQAHRAGLAGPGSQNHAPPNHENRNKNARGPPPIQPTPHKTGGSRGPPSATSLKFNPSANAFNPSASAFKPSSKSGTSVAPSPRSGLATRTISPAGPPPSVFGARKDFTVRGNPLANAAVKPAELKEEPNETAEAKAIRLSTAANGGFPPPYRTAPTWTVPDHDNEPDYEAVFEELRPQRFLPPQAAPSPSAPLPHQYQLPPHLQQGHPGAPHVQHHQHAPHQANHHFNQVPHYEDNHMRPSASQSSFAPSPRMQTQNMNYQSPMPMTAHLAYSQPMQYPGQGHPMNARQFSNPPPMIPVQGGHLAPMMVPPGQPGFVAPQPMAMPFNPQQMHMYPAPNGQPMYGSPGQGPSGYPSPGRGAPMMMHQGSQQGQQPVYMTQHSHFGQPVYAQHPPQNMQNMRAGYGSPQPPYAYNAYPQHQQQHQYPHQPPHRGSNAGYVQPPQPQQHQHIPQPQHGGPAQPTGPSDHAEDAK